MASTRKTHKVIDTVYRVDEGNDVYCGTHQECLDWVSNQGFGYEVVPMTPKEIEIVNEAYKNE